MSGFHRLDKNNKVWPDPSDDIDGEKIACVEGMHADAIQAANLQQEDINNKTAKKKQHHQQQAPVSSSSNSISLSHAPASSAVGQMKRKPGRPRKNANSNAAQGGLYVDACGRFAKRKFVLHIIHLYILEKSRSSWCHSSVLVLYIVHVSASHVDPRGSYLCNCGQCLGTESKIV